MRSNADKQQRLIVFLLTMAACLMLCFGWANRVFAADVLETTAKTTTAQTTESTTEAVDKNVTASNSTEAVSNQQAAQVQRDNRAVSSETTTASNAVTTTQTTQQTEQQPVTEQQTQEVVQKDAQTTNSTNSTDDTARQSVNDNTARDQASETVTPTTSETDGSSGDKKSDEKVSTTETSESETQTASEVKKLAISRDAKATLQPAISMGWHQREDGKWWYQNINGSYSPSKSKWQEINDKWYYFNDNGLMESNAYRGGFLLGADGAWIIQSSGGHWAENNTGWWYTDNTGYYPVNCWLWIDAKSYYFNQYGYMEANAYRDGYWVGNDGAWVMANSGGHWVKNDTGYWYTDNTNWYPKHQWLWINAKRYYFNQYGYMEANAYRDGYWVNGDGSWNPKYSHGHWANDSKGKWYQDGSWYPVNCYLQIDGVRYYFDAAGYLSDQSKTPDTKPTKNPEIEKVVALYQKYLAKYHDNTSDDLFKFVNNPVDADGHLTAAGKQEAYDMVNFYREIYGLNPLTWDDTLEKQSQAAADYEIANDIFTHYPESGDTDVDTGARQSNLAYAWLWSNTDTPAAQGLFELISGWITDDDVNNIAKLGHRLNMLNPRLNVSGFGYVQQSGDYNYSGYDGYKTTTYGTLNVIGDSDHLTSIETEYAPKAIISGYYPVELLATSQSGALPLTLYLGSQYNNKSAANASVVITVDGTPYVLSKVDDPRNAGLDTVDGSKDCFYQTDQFGYVYRYFYSETDYISSNGGGIINMYMPTLVKALCATSDGETDYTKLAGKTLTVTVSGLTPDSDHSDAPTTISYDIHFISLNDYAKANA